MRHLEETVKFLLRLPPELHQQLEQIALAEHRSLNGQILSILTTYTREYTPWQATTVTTADE